VYKDANTIRAYRTCEHTTPHHTITSNRNDSRFPRRENSNHGFAAFADPRCGLVQATETVLAGSLSPGVDQEGHESPHHRRDREPDGPGADVDVALKVRVLHPVNCVGSTAAAASGRLEERQGAQKLQKYHVRNRLRVRAVGHAFLDGLVGLVRGNVGVHGSLHTDDEGRLEDKAFVPVIHRGIAGCFDDLLGVGGDLASDFGIAAENSERGRANELSHQFVLKVLDGAVVALGGIAHIQRYRSGTLVGRRSQDEGVRASAVGGAGGRAGRGGLRGGLAGAAGAGAAWIICSRRLGLNDRGWDRGNRRR